MPGTGEAVVRTLNTPDSTWARLSIPHAVACWTFTGAPSTNGYGQVYFDGRLHTAHVVMWELQHGPVTAGMQLDHLCRNRLCSNPAHLEPVTGLINTRRSPTHNGAKRACPKGHLYAGANLRVRSSDGARLCRECHNADARERKRRRRAELAAAGLTSRGTPRAR